MRILKVISLLLDYPDQHLRDGHAELAQAIGSAREISPEQRIALRRLLDELTEGDLMDVQERYTDLFDRGRSLSLLLFEHVHGESRDRGQAMVDLIRTYEEAGLHLHPDQGGELPDYLPLVLEFVSTLDGPAARDFTGEFAHILNALYAALLKRRSLYAHIPAAVLELMAQAIEPTEVTEDEALDDAWQEPDAFGGCSSRGQQRPDVPQPIHIVRKQAAAPQRGASA